MDNRNYGRAIAEASGKNKKKAPVGYGNFPHSRSSPTTT